MTPEEAVQSRIAGLPAVIAIAGTRVYLDKLPQSPTYPAVRVFLVTDLGWQHLRGSNGFKRARVQADAYSREGSGVDPYAQVASLAAAIDGDGKGSQATGVVGWIGSLGSPAFEVQNIEPIDRTRRYDPVELRVLTMSLEYRVWYRQT